MTNTQALRNLLTGSLCTEEANEFLDAIEEEINELKEEVDSANVEADEAEQKVKELEDEQGCLTSINLGLDTLEYRLKHGNMKIAMQLEHWVNQVKKQNCSGVQIEGGVR